jgi:hypothetical protein
MRPHLFLVALLLSGCGGSTTDDSASGGNSAGAGGDGGAGGGQAGSAGSGQAGSGQAGQGQAGQGQAGQGQAGGGQAGGGQAGGAACPAACSHGCTYSDKKCGQSAFVQAECFPTIPTPLCTDSGPPVCGCDGKVYPAPCELFKAGVDASQLGNCTAPAGHFACGELFCKKGAEYCGGSGSDVGTQASSYECRPIPAACSAPGGAPCACFAGEPCGSFCQASAEGNISVICPGG